MTTAAQLPIRIYRKSGESLQDQVFFQLRGLILDGRLKPGMPVTASRELRRQIGVSRNTAVLAYERLIAEGYLESRPAVGTFVSSHIPEKALLSGNCVCPDTHAPESAIRRQPVVFQGRPQVLYNPPECRPLIDFKVGRPDPGSFPIRVWKRLLAQRVDLAGRDMTEYSDPAGIPELRRAILDHLGPARGIAASPEQIIIVAGCQEALDIVARLFLTPGAPVVIECPGYQGAAYVFESYGAQLLPVPVDGEGLDTSRLPDRPVALAYLTPSHQYPLGATLPLERRFRLLEWAADTGAYLVEDDYDSDFRYDSSPLTAMKGLDRQESVIYLGTFSKSIGAGLRLGYMVVPKPLVRPATDIKTLLNNGQPWLDQTVVADFIAGGEFSNHLRRIRRTYLARRDCLMGSLAKHFGRVYLSGSEGGMHLAWHLPTDFPPAEELAAKAREQGVGLYSLSSGAAHCGPRDELGRRVVLLGYSSLTERQIREGVSRIADLVKRTGISLRSPHLSRRSLSEAGGDSIRELRSTAETASEERSAT